MDPLDSMTAADLRRHFEANPGILLAVIRGIADRDLLDRISESAQAARETRERPTYATLGRLVVRHRAGRADDVIGIREVSP